MYLFLLFEEQARKLSLYLTILKNEQQHGRLLITTRFRFIRQYFLIECHFSEDGGSGESPLEQMLQQTHRLESLQVSANHNKLTASFLADRRALSIHHGCWLFRNNSKIIEGKATCRLHRKILKTSFGRRRPLSWYSQSDFCSFGIGFKQLLFTVALCYLFFVLL